MNYFANRELIIEKLMIIKKERTLKKGSLRALNL